MYFLALSQAPPELAIRTARMNPDTREPANSAMTVKGPKRMPIRIGKIMASTEGAIISLWAPLVEMATQVA